MFTDRIFKSLGIFLLIFHTSGYCQVNQTLKGKSNSSIAFSGTIVGGQFGQDSLLVVFFDDLMKDYVNDTKRFYVHPDEDGKFDFSLPPMKGEIGKIHLQLWGSKKVLGNDIIKLIPSVGFMYYYIENGDRISLNIAIDGKGGATCTFSGRGMDKYLAVNSIFRTSFVEEYFPNDFYTDTKKKETNINTVIKRSELYRNLQKRILEYYKERLDPRINKLLETDIFAKHYSRLLSRLSVWKNKGTDTYLSYFAEEPPHIEEEILSLSKDYISYIIRRTIVEFQVKNHESYSLGDIYNLLKTKYNGALRDKLITSYLYIPIYRGYERHYNKYESLSERDFDYFLADALNTIQHPALKTLIKHKINKYRQGAIAYNFALPDINGNIVKLQDFTGKVVLLDIYSTFCRGCRIFAKTLKESVYPEFKNNPDVVFVAVSVEDDKVIWLQDLESEKNASKKYEVCLWTGGLGSNHPSLKPYDIQAFPTLILIDKQGKIYNSSQNTLTANSSGEEIIQMIYDALRSSRRKDGNNNN